MEGCVTTSSSPDTNDHPAHFSSYSQPSNSRLRDGVSFSARSSYTDVSLYAPSSKADLEKMIADNLFISQKTASVHVSNILAKLGAANRAEAGAKARSLGLDRL